MAGIVEGEGSFIAGRDLAVVMTMTDRDILDFANGLGVHALKVYDALLRPGWWNLTPVHPALTSLILATVPSDGSDPSSSP